jgi:hypothetical protein
MTNIGAFWDSDNTHRGADLSVVGNYPPEVTVIFCPPTHPVYAAQFYFEDCIRSIDIQ